MMEQTLEDLISIIGFSEEDATVLQKYFPQTSKWVEEMVKMFYDMLFAYEPTAKVFKENERPAREETLREWYLTVVSGNVSPKWWRHQWIVGLVHIPRKVTNPFVFGAMSRVQQFFLQKCLEELPLEEAQKLFLAFKRVTDIVAGLISEGYFENYVSAMERSAGFRKSLIERMMDIEVAKQLQEIRTGSAE